MTARYELYLTDDRGTRLALIEKFAFLNFSRIVHGVAPCALGMPLDVYESLGVKPLFQPDRRLEIWRAPADGLLLRLERSFFLRKPKFYTRKEDAVDMVEFSGQGPNSLLARRIVPTRSGTSFSRKTDRIDDMMKEIVQENLGASAVDENGDYDANRDLTLTGQFSVQGDVSVGPSVTKSFAFRNVADILRELHNISLQKNREDSADRSIWFKVADKGGGNFEFQTFADLLGQDRTANSLVFSVENDNFEAPFFEEDHFDEKNFIYTGGQGEGAARAIVTAQDQGRIDQSVWNRVEQFADARQESTPNGLASAGDKALANGRPIERLYATFINNPGSPTVPRSLYGLDWDLGDLLPVSYAERQFSVRVEVVYVSVDDQGHENILGRNEIGVDL